MTTPAGRRTQVLLITGPAGVGKSTLSWEISARLAASGVAHAAIEGDELDRVFPPPTDDELGALRPGTRDVSALTLAGMWSVYRALGHRRLILTGVMLDLDEETTYITAAIPDAEVTVVRLRSTAATLLARLDRREVGSGRDDQLRRSLWQAERMAEQPGDGLILVSTDGETPMALAEEVLLAVGWLDEAAR